MNELEEIYQKRFDSALVRVSSYLQEYLGSLFSDELRIDRISCRPKSVQKFILKSENKDKNGQQKYDDPIYQIQDQIGARIVVFYQPDVDRISDGVRKYFRFVEEEDKIPESEWEFGYFGRHFVALIPPDVVPDGIDEELVPQFFELQIKTLFEHAWSEANHDLGYKPELTGINHDVARRLSWASAQAWGADHVFKELWEETQELVANSNDVTAE